MKLTQEYLKEILDYNHETGVFTWKVDRRKYVKKGNVAGSLHHTGYWDIRIKGSVYRAHRLAFLFMDGYLPENDVDHVDRNKLNNSWINLREVSRSCNMRNQKININNKSGVSGVSWYKRGKKWQSSIGIPKKQIHLGFFDNLIDAVKARWNAELKYNFPNCNTTSSAYNYLKERGAI